MQRKRIALLSIAATAVATGVLLAGAQFSRGMALAAEVAVWVALVFVYIWYKEDVAQRRVRTSTEFNGFIISMSLVAMPVYFIRSRGVVRGIGAAVLFYLGMILWMVVEACAAGVALAASVG
jgi:hypothetical protein